MLPYALAGTQAIRFLHANCALWPNPLMGWRIAFPRRIVDVQPSNLLNARKSRPRRFRSSNWLQP